MPLRFDQEESEHIWKWFKYGNRSPSRFGWPIHGWKADHVTEWPKMVSVNPVDIAIYRCHPATLNSTEGTWRWTQIWKDAHLISKSRIRKTSSEMHDHPSALKLTGQSILIRTRLLQGSVEQTPAEGTSPWQDTACRIHCDFALLGQCERSKHPSGQKYRWKGLEGWCLASIEAISKFPQMKIFLY